MVSRLFDDSACNYSGVPAFALPSESIPLCNLVLISFLPK